MQTELGSNQTPLRLYYIMDKFWTPHKHTPFASSLPSLFLPFLSPLLFLSCLPSALPLLWSFSSCLPHLFALFNHQTNMLWHIFYSTLFPSLPTGAEKHIQPGTFSFCCMQWHWQPQKALHLPPIMINSVADCCSWPSPHLHVPILAQIFSGPQPE